MGVVYGARDPRLDRQVAIKVLPAEVSRDPQARERLRREALAAAALDHPYICKVFEIGEHEGTMFLVMEYIVGETLLERLQQGRMPFAEALRVAGEIAEALQEAHARGFLHRDLKPANIMLTGQGHVKVMDFGLAKRLPVAFDEEAPTMTSSGDVDEPLGSRSELTVTGAVLGTPGHMSPEQLRGESLSQRSDVFSFGLLLAEMLCGRHPFRHASAAETSAAVLYKPPTLSPDLPPRLTAFVERLLAKEIEDRPASMEEVGAELSRLKEAMQPAAAPGTAEAAQGSGRRPAWIVAAVVVVALAMLGGYFVFRSGDLWPGSVESQAVSGAARIQSIVVLPLDNYSGDPQQDYFAEGMTDELTADLASISQLRVISRGSAMQFKGAQRPPTPEIAKVLNVDAIVEGSVLRSGDRVRITAQLIDARDDRHLWAKSFERDSRDVLALQDELAAAIAQEIHVQLSPAEESRLSAAASVDPEAYDAYLKGRYFFNRPSDENLQKAITRFEEAIRLDPNYAPAHSGLSDAYLWAGFNEGFMTASEARPRARVAAEKAVALDDRSAEAHTSLAVFKLFYEWDWDGCETEFRKAFELNPSYAYAHDQFSLGLAFQGRFEESIAQGKLAAELDPLNPQILIDALFAFAMQSDFDTARDLAEQAADLDPTFSYPPWVSGWIDLQAGRAEDAIANLQKAVALDAPPFIRAWLAYAFGVTGDRERALATFEEVKARSLNGSPTAFNEALLHLGLGDHPRAISYLEQAHASDSQWMGWLGRDRVFDPLRSDARFSALLRELGFES